MLLQADTGDYYENPMIGTRFWRVVDKFFMMIMCGKNKSIRHKIANKIVGTVKQDKWATFKLNSDVSSIFDFGDGQEICREYVVEIVNVIPSELIMKYDGIFNQKEVKELIELGRRNSIRIFRWEYTGEEIRKIIKGEMKSLLFNSDLKWYVRNLIKRQLGEEVYRMIEKGKVEKLKYWLGKPIPQYDMMFLRGNLKEIFS